MSEQTQSCLFLETTKQIKMLTSPHFFSFQEKDFTDNSAPISQSTTRLVEIHLPIHHKIIKIRKIMAVFLLSLFLFLHFLPWFCSSCSSLHLEVSSALERISTYLLCVDTAQPTPMWTALRTQPNEETK